jgi:hypothetical protein
MSVIVLVVVVLITASLLYSSVCSRIDTIRVEIRQQIFQEIPEKKITFPTQEDMDAYVAARMQAELTKRGLDLRV